MPPLAISPSFNALLKLTSFQAPLVAANSDIAELEFKHRLRGTIALNETECNKHAIQTLLALKNDGWALGKPWRRTIVTAYYDNFKTDPNLYFLAAQKISLRVRCEMDSHGQIYRPDISIKVELPVKNSMPIRLEFEAPLNLFENARGYRYIEFSFDTLEQRYANSDVWHVVKDRMPLDFRYYREVGAIACDRINQKIGMVVTHSNTIPHKHAKSAFYLPPTSFSKSERRFHQKNKIYQLVTEAGIDRSQFTFPNSDKIWWDGEFEQELKTGELDKYDPRPLVSSPDIPEDYIARALITLDEHLTILLNNIKFASDKNNDPEVRLASKRARLFEAAQNFALVASHPKLTFMGKAGRVLLLAENSRPAQGRLVATHPTTKTFQPEALAAC